MAFDTQQFFSRRRKKTPTPVGAQPVIESAGKPRKMSVLTKIKLAVQLKRIIQNNTTMTSWKSKLGGILLALAAPALALLPHDYQWVSGALSTIGGILLAGGRDNTTTSEEVKSAAK